MLFSVVAVLLAAVLPAAAQEDGDLPTPRDAVPVREEAELIFEQALEAFEEGDYGMAYRRFRLVVRDYRLHRKTTAALLMGGKARYRQGEYAEAIETLQTLVNEYPTSRYRDEAQRVIRFARMQMEQASTTRETIRLGLLLPATEGDNAARTQALFNGIRLAVEEHNGAGGEQAIRMIYRETGGGAGSVREATRSLIREDVAMIVGPLYSEQARAAAAVAEEEGVVLVAPLATDEAVSAGRRFVFQANPTIAMRGKQMAQLAVHGLMGADSLGVVTEAGNEVSEQMAEAFRQEVRRLGNQVALYKRLPGAEGWHDLSRQLGGGNVENLDALYLPIAGSNARELVNAALSGIDRLGQRVRILGNSNWHDLPTKQLASTYNTIYGRVFHPEANEAEGRSFREQYRQLAGQSPNRLAYTGYDVTRFLLTQMQAHPNAPLHEALHQGETYEGLGMRFNFEEGNVNEAMFFLRYRRGQIELLR